MWSADEVVQLQQRVMGVDRLDREDIERRSGQPSRTQRLGKGHFIDDSPSGAVDQEGPSLDTGQRLLVEQIPGVGGQRHVDRHVVRVCEHLFQGAQLATHAAGCGRRDEGIVRHHLHPHPQAALNYHRADVADSNHAQGLVEELATLKLPLLPLSGLHARGRLREVAGDGHHHRHRQLSDGDRIAARRIHHHDPMPVRRLQVDVVHADPGATDHLEVSAGFDDFRGHLGGAAHGERVVLANFRLKLCRLETDAHVHRQPLPLPQNLRTFFRQVIGNQNLHWLDLLGKI